jgi:hypothetical protein
METPAWTHSIDAVPVDRGLLRDGIVGGIGLAPGVTGVETRREQELRGVAGKRRPPGRKALRCPARSRRSFQEFSARDRVKPSAQKAQERRLVCVKGEEDAHIVSVRIARPMQSSDVGIRRNIERLSETADGGLDAVIAPVDAPVVARVQDKTGEADNDADLDR